MIDAATWGPRQCVLPLPINTVLIQKQKIGDDAIDFFYEQKPLFGFEQDVLARFREIKRWVCRMKVAHSGATVGGALDPVERPEKEPTTILQEINIPTPEEIAESIGKTFTAGVKPLLAPVLVVGGVLVAVLVALAFAKAN